MSVYSYFYTPQVHSPALPPQQANDLLAGLVRKETGWIKPAGNNRSVCLLLIFTIQRIG
jgi:hypothetical protein